MFIMMMTQNGIINEYHHMVSNGTSGFLLFGPYMELQAGYYEVIFTIALTEYYQEHIATLDVSSANDDISFANELRIYNHDFLEGSTQRFTIPFSLAEDTSHIEFRAFVTNDTILAIESVTLSRFNNY